MERIHKGNFQKPSKTKSGGIPGGNPGEIYEEFSERIPKEFFFKKHKWISERIIGWTLRRVQGEILEKKLGVNGEEFFE